MVFGISDIETIRSVGYGHASSSWTAYNCEENQTIALNVLHYHISNGVHASGLQLVLYDACSERGEDLGNGNVTKSI